MVLPHLLAFVIGIALVICGLYYVFKFIYEEITSPWRDIPGPKSANLFYGNFKQIWESEIPERWVKEYGATFKYRGLFNITRLYTTDTKAINHILVNSDGYQKPTLVQRNFRHVLGEGVLIVEGDKHRQQKIMNPAFGPSQIRELTEVFVTKAIQLRDIWAAEISKQGGAGRIDVLSWLSRMSLDVIGIAGFNYKFDALNANEKPNELNQAFATIFRAEKTMSVFPLLQSKFPILLWIPTEREAQIQIAKKTMARIGSQILHDSKASIEATTEKGGSVMKDSWQARDLLSLLVRANMSTDLPEGQRLTDVDVLAQVPTFLAAGHETTSVGATWALYALTQNPAIQTKLRNEILTLTTDNPTMDELNALPYLDYVVRETMRLYAPVPLAFRVAMKDDILPLNKSLIDKKGNAHDGVRIRKGQSVLVPILALNRDESLWGEDAPEFKPERWESVPEAVNTIPGIWANLLTFLGGPRACIGYRFSLVEMKALLFTLVRTFEFELAVPAKDIIKKSAMVQRPMLATDPDGANQMPLLIKPYQHA